MALSPTLWRTCRVLSGETRLALFRGIVRNPGWSVSQLAEAERISWSRASQELRRLQSRGLVGVERVGRHVRYYPESDPLVPSARPLLRVMQEIFTQEAPPDHPALARMAKGLSHPRRIDIVRALQEGPLGLSGLQARVHIPLQTLQHHLKFLREGGWVVADDKVWKAARNDSPLAKSLLKLL